MKVFRRISHATFQAFQQLRLTEVNRLSTGLSSTLLVTSSKEAKSAAFARRDFLGPLPRCLDVPSKGFHTAIAPQRDGHGRSETADSRGRRGTLEEEPSVSVDEEDELALQEDVDRQTSSYRPAPQPQVAFGSRKELDVHTASSLGLLDLTDKDTRKGLLEKIAMGELDLFGRLPGSDSSVPEGEMQAWMRDFRIKIVDVNRISKGSRTGGIGRFSALAVVGNGKGVVGLGTGKSKNISDAIKKANHQALGTLFFVPRYKEATILHPITANFGRCKVTMYPRSTGSGCRASILVSHVCQLAGIRDIGVKVHGTRNVRNTVKALIRGFESQTPVQELADISALPPRSVVSEQRLAQTGGVATVQSIGY